MRLRSTKVGPVYGRTPKGCDLCGKGAKLVLFSTGLCDFNCFYCPISNSRKNSNEAFANERPIKKIDDLLDEVKRTNAMGAGVTGGDPLNSEKTFIFVKTLKENFSEKFHVHLYTKTTNPIFLGRANDAGVDEIRFHWVDPKPALDWSWDVGAEVPVIPGQFDKLKSYLTTLNNLDIKFANLNELEFSDSNFEALLSNGLKHIDNNSESIGVGGSEELALDIVGWAKSEKLSLSVHYCSAQTKLFTQLVERYKRSAKNTMTSFEKMTTEGTILVGEVKNTPENRANLRKYEDNGEWLRTSIKDAKKLKGRVVEYWPTFDKQIIEITVF